MIVKLVEDTIMVENVIYKVFAGILPVHESNVPVERDGKLLCRIQADTTGTFEQDPTKRHDIRAKIFRAGNSYDSCSVEFNHLTKEVYVYGPTMQLDKKLKHDKKEVNRMLDAAVPFIVFASGELKNQADCATNETDEALKICSLAYKDLDKETIDELREVGLGRAQYSKSLKQKVRKAKRNYEKN